MRGTVEFEIRKGSDDGIEVCLIERFPGGPIPCGRADQGDGITDEPLKLGGGRGIELAQGGVHFLCECAHGVERSPAEEHSKHQLPFGENVHDLIGD